jgi:hypothetical protein
MPRGCSIRDRGRIISFTQPEFQENDACIVVVIVVDSSGSHSYSFGGRYRLHRSEVTGAWAVVEVLSEWIT